MSVQDGEMDLRSVVMVDYDRKEMPLVTRPKPADDNCLIIGLQRDSLAVGAAQRPPPDVLCPARPEHYKEGLERFSKKYPLLTKRYLSKDIDPTPILNDIQDNKRTEYAIKYCSRELPFMSINLTRRAKALQTLRLPDDVVIPATTARGSYRPPPRDKIRPPAATAWRPLDDTREITNKLRTILRISTGDSTYGAGHGLLGKVLLQSQPFGPAREEPRYGRWKTPMTYTYNMF